MTIPEQRCHCFTTGESIVLSFSHGTGTAVCWHRRQHRWFHWCQPWCHNVVYIDASNSNANIYTCPNTRQDLINYLHWYFADLKNDWTRIPPTSVFCNLPLAHNMSTSSLPWRHQSQRFVSSLLSCHDFDIDCAIIDIDGACVPTTVHRTNSIMNFF